MQICRYQIDQIWGSTVWSHTSESPKCFWSILHVFKTKNLVLDVSSGTILDCQVLRSNLPLTMFTCWKSLFPSRFLPAPFPICNEKGLFVLKNQELNGTHKNPDLLKRIALDCLVPKSSFVNMYDWHFPCVKPGIKERVYKIYRVHFPSMAAVNRHKNSGEMVWHYSRK